MGQKTYVSSGFPADQDTVPHAAGVQESRRPDAETIALIDVVWGRLQARLELGLSRVERTVSVLFDRPLEPAEVQEARDLCEAVASKLGLLGLGPAASLIRKASAAFDQPDLDLRDGLALSGLLDDARTALASSVSEVKQLSHSREPLAVVGSVSELVDELIWVAAAQGMPVSHHIDGLASSNRKVAAVLVVVDDPDLTRARPLLRGIRETHPSQPIVVVAPETELADRARVVDTVSLVLAAHSSPLEIVSEIGREVTRTGHSRSVAVFGKGASDLVEPLCHRGLAASTAENAQDLVARLRKGEVRSVVLLDSTGGIRPAELLRLIRTEQSTRATVVVMLSSKTGGSRLHSALRDGADDLFPVDVDIDDLAVVLKARLARRSEIEPIADLSKQSGAVPPSTAIVLMERMLLVSFRQNLPAGVGVLWVPEAEESELEQEIAREFRTEDVISRFDAERIVIALQGVDRRVLLRRMSQIYEKFSLQERGARAVGMEFPIDGRSLEQLLESGNEAKERAEEEGGPVVVGADWQPWQSIAPDVLLVDPDPTLGAVMSATLARRGLKVQHRSDALSALDDLTGHTKAPFPKLVLMELDQLGVDGLEVLRQLRDAGTMDRFKLIVLSGRTQESDLRRAFELGIDDFVTKPFSAPLLLHRIGKALSS